jgi:hypothetical protein
MTKAQISVQFNWIFVFITGAVVLLLILSVAKMRTEEAGEELAMDLTKTLNTIIKASEKTSGTFKEVNLPQEVVIKFTCEDNFSSYKVVGAPQEVRTDYQAIFAPPELQGSKLFTWSLDWSVPFKASTLLLITNDKTLYVFVNDTGGTVIEELYRDFPSNLSKVFVNDADDVEPKNYNAYVFVSDKIVNPSSFDPDKENVYCVGVAPQNNFVDGVGELSFDKCPRRGGPAVTLFSSHFLRKSTVYAAIVSATGQGYNCNMNKALEKLKVLAELHYLRLQNISQELTGQPCYPYYSHPLYVLELMNQTRGMNDFSDLFELSGQLRLDNEDLIRGYNCPLIY